MRYFLTFLVSLISLPRLALRFSLFAVSCSWVVVEVCSGGLEIAASSPSCPIVPVGEGTGVGMGEGAEERVGAGAAAGTGDGDVE